jgi:ribosomal-protein-alanine N-acetyltransferase
MTPAARPGRDIALLDADETAAPLMAAIMDADDVEAWSPESLAKILCLPTTCALLAVEAGDPAGFLLLQVAAQEAEVINLVVAPPARRRGIGLALLAGAMERAREMGARAMFLEVASDNEAAQALYSAAGFRQVGTRPDYYRKGPINYTDALILRCELITTVCD